MNDTPRPTIHELTRRAFLGRSGAGLGALALAELLNGGGRVAADAPAQPGSRGVINPLHFAPKARRVIWLYMAGGMSHLESFDHKPQLAAVHGQPMPESFTRGHPIAQLQGAQLRCFGPQHPFRRYGQSGQEIASIFPHIGSIADDICIVRSLKTEAINHDPAHTFMNTGTTISGRPAMGSWLSYGLGCDADDLPAFCVLTSTGRFGQSQPIAQRQWSAGFLPSRHQGIHLRGTGDPVLYVQNPPGVSGQDRRAMLDALALLNQRNFERLGDPETQTRIAQYEMAFRMQTSVPSLVDLSGESQRVLEMYGPNVREPGTFAHSALMARRLVERGVRVVQILHRGWDQHGDLPNALKNQCDDTDRGTAALLQDLKQRGLLDETLVIWGGEFGRTVYCQGTLTADNYGRDHIRAASPSGSRGAASSRA